MPEKAKAPAIRFKGFTDDWEQCELGDIVKWCKGSNLAKSVLNDVKSGNEVIHYADLYKFSPVISSVIHWSSTDEGTEIPENSVLFPMSDVTPFGLARTTTITKKGVKAGGDTLIGTLENKYSAAFISYQINANSMQILPLVTGTTVRHISASSLSTLEIFSTNIKEQQKITQFFNSLENLITLHQRRLLKMKNVKKAMLEKMFPKNGSDVPEIRFAGFTDAWEKRKYSDTFANLPNNTLARVELNYSSGLAKNIHYGDVLIKFGELLNVEKDEIPYITDGALVDKIRPSKLQNGDVIIADAAEDETVGKCTELINVGEEIIVSGLHTIPCRPTLPFASGYLGYFMNSSAYHTQLLRLMQGTKVSSISKSALQDTVIFHPLDIVEQKKISAYFQQLNNLITLHQRKHEKLKNIKKACLEKMFV